LSLPHPVRRIDQRKVNLALRQDLPSLQRRNSFTHRWLV
jgi:hypothetical protein